MTIVVVTSSIIAVADEIKIFHNIGSALFGGAMAKHVLSIFHDDNVTRAKGVTDRAASTPALLAPQLR
jgi:hypothetical protein